MTGSALRSVVERRLGAFINTPRRRERAFADALRVVAASISSGHSLQVACAQAGDRKDGVVGAAFVDAAAQLAIGVPAPQALAALADRIDVPPAFLFANVMSVQLRRGGDRAMLCHRLARLLHERGRLDREARAATAQARFTARAVIFVPLLAVAGWAWISPASLRVVATPGMAIAVVPAICSITVGVMVVRKFALGSLVLDAPVAPHRRSVSRVMRMIGWLAGNGTLAGQTIRLASSVALVVSCLVAVSRPSPLLGWCWIVAVGCAAAWPALQLRRARQLLDETATVALPTLLELSIALLAAGATPREVFQLALDGSPEPLRDLVLPALDQLELGRTPMSALQALPVVQASPELDAWAHALAAGDRFGAPATDTLETLLRDARTNERERFRGRAATMGPRIQLATVLLIVPGVMWIMLAVTAHGLLRELGRVGMLATG